MTIHSIHVLTIGGTQLWEEAGHLRLKEDVLEPNDIYERGDVRVIGGICLCEVDTERTQIDDFYKWKELPIHDQETFCWRDFYYFTGVNNNAKDSWLDIPSKECLGSVPVSQLISTIVQEHTILV